MLELNVPISLCGKEVSTNVLVCFHSQDVVVTVVIVEIVVNVVVAAASVVVVLRL